MFPSINYIDPSDSDLFIDKEPQEEPEQAPPDERKLAALHDIEECFSIFDPKKTGFMDIKYLEKAFSCLGIFMTASELEDEKNKVVKNGQLMYEEFEACTLEKLMETDDYDTLKESFRVFDPDNEGVVPTDRFKRWMTTLGDPLTDKEVKDLIKMGDPAKKGVIAYDDLVAILASK